LGYLGLDWQNKYQKTYVDIKSIEIRTVLREVLKDVSGIGLREDKPTVCDEIQHSLKPVEFYILGSIFVRAS